MVKLHWLTMHMERLCKWKFWFQVHLLHTVIVHLRGWLLSRITDITVNKLNLWSNRLWLFFSCYRDCMKHFRFGLSSFALNMLMSEYDAIVALCGIPVSLVRRSLPRGTRRCAKLRGEIQGKPLETALVDKSGSDIPGKILFWVETSFENFGELNNQ